MSESLGDKGINAYVRRLREKGYDIRTLLSVLTGMHVLHDMFGEKYGEYLGLEQTEFEKLFKAKKAERFTRAALMSTDELESKLKPTIYGDLGCRVQADYLDTALFRDDSVINETVTMEYVDSVSMSEVKAACVEAVVDYPNFGVFTGDDMDGLEPLDKVRTLDYVQRMADENAAEIYVGKQKCDEGVEKAVMFGVEDEDLDGHEEVANFGEMKLALRMNINKVKTKDEAIAAAAFSRCRVGYDRKTGDRWFVTDVGVDVNKTDGRMEKRGFLIPTSLDGVYKALGTGLGAAFYLHRGVVRRTVTYFHNAKSIKTVRDRVLTRRAAGHSDIDCDKERGDYLSCVKRIVSNRSLTFNKVAKEFYGATDEEVICVVEDYDKHITTVKKPGKVCRKILLDSPMNGEAYRERYVEEVVVEENIRLRDLAALMSLDRYKSGLAIDGEGVLSVV
jgi:hypothetical protein